MKKRILILSTSIAILLTSPMAAAPKGNGNGGGGGSSIAVQTTIYDFCQLVETACHILSDDAAQLAAVYRDESLAGGDTGVTMEFRRGDYKATLRSSSGRDAWVSIISSGCADPFLGRLRFLRIDDVAGQAPNDSTLTTAYAQIDGPDGIWNLFWSPSGVQSDRDENGLWNVYSKDAHTVEVQRPGARKKWETCDTAATVHFDIEIAQP